MANQTNNVSSTYELISQAAQRSPDANAITFVKAMAPAFIDETISYSQLLGHVSRTARMLREHLPTGSEKPGVISFLLPNIPQASFLLWGSETIGIANPLNPLLSEDALTSLMEKAGTDIIVALGPNPNSDIWQKSVAVSQRLSKKPKLISALIPAGDEFDHYDTLLPQFKGGELPKEWLPNPDDIAAYFHTGGTTGTPKLAQHTHTNQLTMVHSYLGSMNLSEGDTIVNGLPMFHVAGSLVIALGSVAAGANMLLPSIAGFRDPNVIQRHWDIVEHYKVSVSGGISTSIASMAGIPIGQADISSLKCMITGGAPTPISVAKEIMALTERPLYQIYGLTEVAGGIALPNINEAPVVGSSGYILDSVEVRINSKQQQAGTVGEICVRGPMVFSGYLGEAESPLKEGWLHTGDLGYLDDKRNLFITGRAKDLIIRSGHNIDPAVIEACLDSHPDVSMSAAVAKPDLYAGELPVAYVQLHPNASVTEEELINFAMENISEPPACPKSVHILKELPVTAVGKIHKPSLRVLTAEEVVNETLKEFSVQLNSKLLESGVIAIQVEVNSAERDLVQKHCITMHEALGLQFTLCEVETA